MTKPAELMHYKRYNTINFILRLICPMSLLFAIVFLSFTCSNKQAEKGYQSVDNSISIPTKREFSMPSIPDSIKRPEHRAAYLVSNYWNNFDFADTTYIHLPDITEQAFVDYLDILPHLAIDDVHCSISNMLDKAIEMDTTYKVYLYFLELYKSYLHDANSPMLNEEIYITVANYILEDTVSNIAVKERARFNLSMMLKNRKGNIATDIIYTTDKGETSNLHSLNKAYTLLYFYNPDCHACKETSTYLMESPVIKELLEKGRLDILALYPDEDISLWKRYIMHIPSLWINAYDKEQSLRNGLLYDLKAIPSLYLLDSKKRVLLKNTNEIVVERYLYRQ